MTNLTNTNIKDDSEICPNVIDFIKTILSYNLSNPLGEYLKREDTFNLSKTKSKEMLSLIVAKAFEQDSPFVPLAIHLLDSKTIQPIQPITHLATLHYLQLKQAFDAYTNPINEINQFMKEASFGDTQLVVKNPEVDQLFCLYDSVFKNTSPENLLSINTIFTNNQTLNQFKNLLPEYVLKAIDEESNFLSKPTEQEDAKLKTRHPKP